MTIIAQMEVALSNGYVFSDASNNDVVLYCLSNQNFHIGHYEESSNTTPSPYRPSVLTLSPSFVRVSCNLIPINSSSVDLGTPNNRFNKVFLTTNGEIHLGETKMAAMVSGSNVIINTHGLQFDSSLHIAAHPTLSNAMLLNNAVPLQESSWFFDPISRTKTTTSNYVGIGTTSPISKLHLQDGNVIVENGRIAIDSQDPQYPLHVNGTIFTTQSVLQQSDARLKEDLRPIDNALSIVSTLNGYTYQPTTTLCNVQQNKTTQRKMGLIAQEVEEHVPEVVSQDANGFLSVAYANMVPLLIESIKELASEVASLRQKCSGIV